MNQLPPNPTMEQLKLIGIGLSDKEAEIFDRERRGKIEDLVPEDYKRVCSLAKSVDKIFVEFFRLHRGLNEMGPAFVLLNEVWNTITPPDFNVLQNRLDFENCPSRFLMEIVIATERYDLIHIPVMYRFCNLNDHTLERCWANMRFMGRTFSVTINPESAKSIKNDCQGFFTFESACEMMKIKFSEVEIKEAKDKYKKKEIVNVVKEEIQEIKDDKYDLIRVYYINPEVYDLISVASREREEMDVPKDGIFTPSKVMERAFPEDISVSVASEKGIEILFANIKVNEIPKDVIVTPHLCIKQDLIFQDMMDDGPSLKCSFPLPKEFSDKEKIKIVANQRDMEEIFEMSAVLLMCLYRAWTNSEDYKKIMLSVVGGSASMVGRRLFVSALFLRKAYKSNGFLYFSSFFIRRSFIFMKEKYYELVVTPPFANWHFYDLGWKYMVSHKMYRKDRRLIDYEEVISAIEGEDFVKHKDFDIIEYLYATQDFYYTPSYCVEKSELSRSSSMWIYRRVVEGASVRNWEDSLEFRLLSNCAPDKRKRVVHENVAEILEGIFASREYDEVHNRSVVSWQEDKCKLPVACLTLIMGFALGEEDLISHAAVVMESLPFFLSIHSGGVGSISLSFAYMPQVGFQYQNCVPYRFRSLSYFNRVMQLYCRRLRDEDEKVIINEGSLIITGTVMNVLDTYNAPYSIVKRRVNPLPNFSDMQFNRCRRCKGNCQFKYSTHSYEQWFWMLAECSSPKFLDAS